MGEHDPEFILAGDFGGTKTHLGLYQGTADNLRLLRFQSYPTRDGASAVHLITRFLEENPGPSIDEACLGVAAPVVAGVAQTINLPWVVDAQRIRTHFGFRNLHLINDLVALAAAIPYLQPEQILPLNAVEASGNGHIGLLAAGTGLGEALLLWDGRGYLPLPSEGGHKDFAPATERQFRLQQFLAAKYGGHASVERVLSGPGLVDLYRFLREESGTPEPSWLQERMAEQDPAGVISETALADRDPVCSQSLSLFVEVYGAEAGNLALQGLTMGGIYVGGGIGPKIRPALLAGSFMRAFAAKGRMAQLLGRVPVRLIIDPYATLFGAAVYGRLATEED